MESETLETQDASTKIKGALKTIPSLGKLLYKLARDPRVPRRNKLIFGGIAGYLLLPFDLIPDWIPGLGQVDDILLVALGLDAILNQVPEDVLREHWDGDDDILETIRSVLSVVTTFVPEKVKDRLFSSQIIDQ